MALQDSRTCAESLNGLGLSGEHNREGLRGSYLPISQVCPVNTVQDVVQKLFGLC